MCTMIVEKVKINGCGKGKSGWFNLGLYNRLASLSISLLGRVVVRTVNIVFFHA